MMRFALEIIPANSAELRLAIAYISIVDIIERRCLVIIVRLPEPMGGARRRSGQEISISLEYWFHVNFSALAPDPRLHASLRAAQRLCWHCLSQIPRARPAFAARERGWTDLNRRLKR